MPAEVQVQRSQFASNAGAIGFQPSIASATSLVVTDPTFTGNVATGPTFGKRLTLRLDGGDRVSGVRRCWTCTPAIRWTRPTKV